MSCVSIPSSFAIFNSMSTISIPKNAAIHRHAKINNGNGRTVSILARRTPRLGFQPSAMMVDDTSKGVRPHTITFAPTVWGDLLSTFSVDDQVQQKYCEEIESLKKEAARSMWLDATSSTKVLVLIDTLERLELAYHFETEIENKLKLIYDSEEEDYDLFTTALRFRLLRQHQYHVSCKVFDKFVDKDYKLKEGLSSDVEGLLSLYEAAHVRIHNEKVLDEAVAFTTHHLSLMLPQLEFPLKEKVQQALNYPLHRSVPILTLRSHIDIYENDDSRDELLLRLAKFNFNFMQNIYKNEIVQLTKWWNKWDLKSKLPYIRDRLVECYIWGLAYHSEPEYSHIRIIVTKIYVVFTILDDTLDNYATLEEGQAFTEALERWDMKEIDVLPADYLKVVYKFIMSFSEELEHEAEKQGKAYIIPYYIETMKKTGWAYFRDLKWVMGQEKLPSFEEYIIHSWTTTLVYSTSLVTAIFIKSSTKQTVDWALSDSQIFKAASEINRLLGDLATYQRESRDGTMNTCLDFYMKDRGVTMEEARCALEELLEDKWKEMNAAWVDSSSSSSMVAKEIVVQLVNLGRISEMIYKDGEDGYTNPHNNTTPIILALFQDVFHT